MESLIAAGIIKRAKCQSGSQYSNTMGYLQRADSDQLRAVFEKYASANVNGVPYMTDEDFVVKFLQLFPSTEFNKHSVKLLCGILDQSKDGLISFEEFQTFEGRLCVPDALYRTAFQLFDTDGSGAVSYAEFCEIISETSLHKNIPFPLESSDLVKLYFGKDKKRLVTYSEFSQLIHDFHDEYAHVAFKAKDIEGTGFISSKEFFDIMVAIKSHLLTDAVKQNLMSAVHGHQVSFPFFMAFISLLSNIELIKKIYLNATNGSRTTEVTKEEFLHSAQMMSQITPLEVDILFNLCDLLHQTGKIMYSDLQSISPEQYMKQITKRLTDLHAVSSPEERGVFIQILESVYRFALGSIAGATGATAVYPIDLVKTRMQNQRTGSYIGELMYRNSFDCFKKVIRHEGVTGLYRGLVPQLMGVAPEKAIKLTMNDLVRDKLSDKKGQLPVYAEMIAGGTVNDLVRDQIRDKNTGKIPVVGEIISGGCAGASQVMFTNPLEIVKIRLQVAGEVASTQRVSALSVVRELGFFGLYKGARACLLRDIPFSAIYFPAYAHLKPKFADENGYNGPLSLLVSGAIAGMPAASLVTPADVIKTRLQVVAREGQTSYNGLLDATRKIYAEEGFRAFWKGAIARMCRSSPQFGVTLVTYELLQRTFYVDFGGSRPTGSTAEATGSEIIRSSNPDHVGGFQVAMPIFDGIESKFGLMLPKFSHGIVNVAR